MFKLFKKSNVQSNLIPLLDGLGKPYKLGVIDSPGRVRIAGTTYSCNPELPVGYLVQILGRVPDKKCWYIEVVPVVN